MFQGNVNVNFTAHVPVWHGALVIIHDSDLENQYSSIPIAVSVNTLLTRSGIYSFGRCNDVSQSGNFERSYEAVLMANSAPADRLLALCSWRMCVLRGHKLAAWGLAHRVKRGLKGDLSTHSLLSSHIVGRRCDYNCHLPLHRWIHSIVY